MNKIARGEYAVIIAAALLFVGLLIPSLLHARRETRDGIRRQEIAAFKQVLEEYYNRHNTYPLEFNAAPHRYVVVESDKTAATAWYLQARLENEAPTHGGYNAEEGHSFDFRVIQDGNSTYYEVCGGTPTCAVTDRR